MISGIALTPSLRNSQRRLDNRAGLRPVDFRKADAEARAAMPQHRIKLRKALAHLLQPLRIDPDVLGQLANLVVRPCGMNSCSGGSSNRIVTGLPAISRRMPTKSLALHRNDLRQGALALLGDFPQGSFREPPRCVPGPKNMCSVRHSPMPSAPNSIAILASPGVSALARTPRLRSCVRPSHEIAEILRHLGLRPSARVRRSLRRPNRRA